MFAREIYSENSAGSSNSQSIISANVNINTYVKYKFSLPGTNFSKILKSKGT